MKIYQALSDVHYRLSETGQIIRCCGVCGAELRPLAPDPCVDGQACRARASESDALGQKSEFVSLECEMR